MSWASLLTGLFAAISGNLRPVGVSSLFPELIEVA